MGPPADRPGERSFPESVYPFQELTRRVIEGFYEVHRTFGFGYLESVYRRALAVELHFRGIPIAQEVPFQLLHRGILVGHYRADLVVDSSVVVETKTGLLLDPVAPTQVLNYLKASGLPVGLVLHFGPRPEIKRVVLSTGRYQSVR